jgi:hypothetical protein
MDDLAEKLKQRALSMKQYEKMTEEREEGEWIPPPSFVADSSKKDKDRDSKVDSILFFFLVSFVIYFFFIETRKK